MSTEQIIGLALALLVMGVGVVGCVLPGLPGTPLVLAAALGHRLYFGAESVSNLVLIILIGLTLASLGLDYLATTLGAKRFGATWRGAVGALLGALVGIFFSLPGILLGPFVGATVFEMWGGKSLRQAWPAGAGAVLGLFAGAVAKVAVAGIMVALFTASVLGNSLQDKVPAAL